MSQSVLEQPLEQMPDDWLQEQPAAELFETHDHAHEQHACSAECSHHQADRHVDHAEAIEHAHGPDCGHVHHRQAQSEIDTPHVHSEACGHLHHHDAATHVDRGAEPVVPEHRHIAVEHQHHAGCGHVAPETAREYIDTPVTPAEILAVVQPEVAAQHLPEQAVAPVVSQHAETIVEPAPDRSRTAGATLERIRPDKIVTAVETHSSVVPLPVERPRAVARPTETLIESADAPVKHLFVETIVNKAAVVTSSEIVSPQNLITEPGIDTPEAIDEVSADATKPVHLVETPLKLVNSETEPIETTDLPVTAQAWPNEDMVKTPVAEIVDESAWLVANVTTERTSLPIETVSAMLTQCIETSDTLTPPARTVIMEQLVRNIARLSPSALPELVPLLEAVTDKLQLPQLERLLESIVAGAYQDASIIARTIVSFSDNSSTSALQLGKQVLSLLISASKQRSFR